MSDLKRPAVCVLAGLVIYDLGIHPVDGRPHLETGEGAPATSFGGTVAATTSSSMVSTSSVAQYMSWIKTL
jgi:hypothetical protein